MIKTTKFCGYKNYCIKNTLHGDSEFIINKESPQNSQIIKGSGTAMELEGYT